ncbi:SU10 major capsid protein [Aneurinibacillus tyrosinisolvens]|uniref:SU10 major capsid protein n=1 Tax=Aneurinibacillus tyrosinisolvens TaxID=1443435 RepID=UPI00063F3B85|nr:DUF5309 family protein [Aneurinibacillus tyrosinisolvens]
MGFSSSDYVVGQVHDLKQGLIDVNPERTPFLNLLLAKTVSAAGATVNWIEKEIDETTAVTMQEGGDRPAYKKDTLSPMNNNLELFGATAEVTHTAQASTASGITDLMNYEVANKTSSLKRRIEDKLLHGTKGFATGTYTTDGVFNLINAANRVTTTALVADDFETMLSKTYDAGVNYNQIVFCNAFMKKKINSFGVVTFLAREKMLGFDVSIYSSAFGDVTFIDVPKMTTNEMFVANPDFFELPELIPFQGVVQGANGSKTAIYIETQVGLKLLNSKAAASLKVTA